MTDPIWKQAPGHAGYEVSDTGLVRRTRLIDPYGRVVSEACLINQSLTGPRKSQYYEVSMGTSEPTVRTRRKVHHLVLEAFVGPRPSGHVGRHLDDDRSNNTRANLAWGTQARNVEDMVRNGGHWNTRKTACKRGHDLTADNIYTYSGSRKCKTCARDRAAAQYAATKVKSGQPEHPDFSS